MTQETSTRIGGFTNNNGYDGAGNPTVFRGSPRAFNSNNQDTANAFDLNGNPTTYGGVSCAYDAENRMTAYGNIMTAGYLEDGRRAWKTNSAGTTYFLYADGVIPICELDSAGNVTAVNSQWNRGLLARHTAAGTSVYAFDAQGSAANRLDQSGNELSASTFDAFGSRVTTDTSADPYGGFGGMYGYRTDFESGLEVLGERYYDCSKGRFLTRDPIGYEGGVNVYNYTANRVGVHSDPTGLDDIIELPPGTWGLPFDHRYIHLQTPCNGFTDVGYWPNGAGIPNCHIVVIVPDPRVGTGGYPVISDPTNNFDAALCACIKASVPGLGIGPGLTPMLPLPGHANDGIPGFGGYFCSEWARDMWNCARRRLGRGPIPSPKPGRPPTGPPNKKKSCACCSR
jgi:RHS repeat-associated protein